MKQTLYVRCAKHPRGGKPKVVTTTRPSHLALEDGSGNPMPTVAFAIEVNVPDELFSQAQKVVASIDVTSDDVRVPVSVAIPA